MYVKTLYRSKQSGFTLVELMVGLVIGLLATLVIMQTFSAFEGQKRTTVGTADAQVNGSIALNNIQRQVQMAGYGLPIFDATSTKNRSPLRCSPSTIDHDIDNTTAKVDLFPISITDGGTGSDQITVRYFSGSEGGISVNVTGITGSAFTVDNNLGCSQNDLALVVDATTCNVGRVTTTDANLAATPTTVNLTGSDVGSMATGAVIADFSKLTCLGGTMNSITYRINNGELENNNQPVISGIVSLQAQYGISANANSNQVTSWVDATGGTWAAPTIADRNRIRAIRVAIVAQNGLLEKTNVTAAAPVVAALNGSAAPVIDLTAIPNWQQYRYRMFDTVIPIRNLTWSGEWL